HLAEGERADAAESALGIAIDRAATARSSACEQPSPIAGESGQPHPRVGVALGPVRTPTELRDSLPAPVGFVAVQLGEWDLAGVQLAVVILQVVRFIDLSPIGRQTQSADDVPSVLAGMAQDVPLRPGSGHEATCGNVQGMNLIDAVRFAAGEGELPVGLVSIDIAGRRHPERAVPRQDVLKVTTVGRAAIHPPLAFAAKKLADPNAVKSGEQGPLVAGQTKDARPL